MKEFLLSNKEDSKKLSQSIASNLKRGDIVTFTGDLGSGKSFFCREIVRYICGNNINVTSPTFNLLQEYNSEDGTSLYHFDLYRLSFFEEIFEIGLEDAILSEKILLIEWPDIANSILPKNRINIKIVITGNTSRKVLIENLLNVISF